MQPYGQSPTRVYFLLSPPGIINILGAKLEKNTRVGEWPVPHPCVLSIVAPRYYKYPGGDIRKKHTGGGMANPPPVCSFLLSPPGMIDILYKYIYIYYKILPCCFSFRFGKNNFRAVHLGKVSKFVDD